MELIQGGFEAYAAATDEKFRQIKKLPAGVNEIVDNFAKGLGTDPHFLLGILLPVIAAIADSTLKIGSREMKNNIYMLIVGSKGTGKSAGYKAVSDALKRINFNHCECMDQVTAECQLVIQDEAGAGFHNTCASPDQRCNLNKFFHWGPSIGLLVQPSYAISGLKEAVMTLDGFEDRWLITSGHATVCSDADKDWDGTIQKITDFFSRVQKLKGFKYSFDQEAQKIMEQKDAKKAIDINSFFSDFRQNKVAGVHPLGKESETTAKVAAIMQVMKQALGLVPPTSTVIDGMTMRNACDFLDAVRREDACYRRVAKGLPALQNTEPSLSDCEVFQCMGRKVLSYPSNAVPSRDISRMPHTDCVMSAFNDLENMGLGNVDRIGGNRGWTFNKNDTAIRATNLVSRIMGYQSPQEPMPQMAEEANGNDANVAPKPDVKATNIHVPESVNDTSMEEVSQESQTGEGGDNDSSSTGRDSKKRKLFE